MKRKCGRRVRPQLCSGEEFSCHFKNIDLFPICVCHLHILGWLFGSHLGPPRRRTTAEEEERVKHPKPEVGFKLILSACFMFSYALPSELNWHSCHWWLGDLLIFLQDSVYYHPTLNPTGAPPPGKPPMFKSSIGMLSLFFIFVL